MSDNEPSQTFPIAKIKSLVEDLLIPNPVIYWMDFLFSVSLGWGSFILILQAELFSIQQIFFYLIASLAIYRAAIFTHELVHLKKGTFKFFRFVWNVLAGCPLLIPSFFFSAVHSNHHQQKAYGTLEDGEYYPFAVKSPYKIISYILFSFCIPILFYFRSVVLTPLSYLNKNLRTLVWERTSSLAIDLSYRRPPPYRRDESTWQLQELLASFYGIGVTVLIIMGQLPLGVLILWYLICAPVHLLNALRTLGSHYFRYSGEKEMGLTEQYLDSVNIPGNLILTGLWTPLGLRYHALHHLIPEMPYHALRQAHRRLMQELPDTSLYEKTINSSLWSILSRLWREARENSR